MMRRIWMHKLGQRLAIVMLAGAATLVTTGAGGALAAGGYGPPAPVPPKVPGGHCVVVTSQTITPAGGTIGPVTIDGASVTLIVPAGAFPVPLQMTLTALNRCAIGTARFRCYKVVAGVGIQVQENGSAYPGPFLKPLSLDISSSSITASSILAVWNGTAFVTDPEFTALSGELKARFDTDPDFAVLTPACRATTAIPGATSAATGKPVLGEGILAGVMLLLGASGLEFARRRRADH
jgi:hypothetical protein